MAHRLAVFVTVGSGNWVTCDYIEEGSNGIELFEFEDGEAIGYVPYDNLGYVEPNEE